MMCGATFRPRATAFLASKPAASSTPGLEVLVQEVIAAACYWHPGPVNAAVINALASHVQSTPWNAGGMLP